MSHKVAKLSDHKFTSKNRLFLDANIWLYNYCHFISTSQSYHTNLDIYSKALHDIYTAKSKIYIDVLIVSEFINRYARLGWEQWKKDEASDHKKKYKDFRRSPEGKRIAAEIADMVKRIMKSGAEKMESRFNRVKINDMLDDYGKGEFDFNDQIIAWLCKREGLILITDDSDFKSQKGISILTENRHLLA